MHDPQYVECRSGAGRRQSCRNPRGIHLGSASRRIAYALPCRVAHGNTNRRDVRLGRAGVLRISSLTRGRLSWRPLSLARNAASHPRPDGARASGCPPQSVIPDIAGYLVADHSNCRRPLQLKHLSLDGRSGRLERVGWVSVVGWHHPIPRSK